MYLPGHFAETRVEVLHALMRAQPFATLVTQGADGLAADKDRAEKGGDDG